MSLSKPKLARKNPYLNTASFRIVLEDHLKLIQTYNSSVVEVSGDQRIRYKYDFNGLLRDLNVDLDYWWITLRVNNLINPLDWAGSDAILLPNTEYINTLLQGHIAVGR